MRGAGVHDLLLPAFSEHSAPKARWLPTHVGSERQRAGGGFIIKPDAGPDCGFLLLLQPEFVHELSQLHVVVGNQLLEVLR